ncbi:MAG: EamA family transporter [Thermoplasmata archaeon]
MELWFFLAVVVALFWGVSQIFAKYSTARIGVAGMALLVTLVETPLYAMGFLTFRNEIDMSAWDAVFATSTCLLGLAGYLCFFESIVDGQVAIAGTISAAYPVLVVLGAIVFLSESMTLVQAFGVLLIIGGVLALSYEPEPGTAHAITRRSLTFAFLAFFAWGVWGLFSKVAVEKITAGNLFGFYVISSLTAPLLYSWVRRVRPPANVPKSPTRKAWSFGAVALATNVFGAMAYSYALEVGNASLVVPTSSAYPIVTVVLAVALLKEKVHRTQWLWLAAVLAGLILVGLTF